MSKKPQAHPEPELFEADPQEVKALLDYLHQAYERYLTNRAKAGQNVRYPDAFMAAHNFHKLVVSDLVRRTNTDELFLVAVTTFAQAMERELEKFKQLPTTEKLAQVLEATGDPKLEPMIKRAREGYYDDFKSPLATPQVQLVADLKEAGHPELVQRVIDGEFDATRAESDAWANSPAGRETFQALLDSTPKRRKRR